MTIRPHTLLANLTSFLYIVLFRIGLIVGIVICSILMSTIASAVNAVIGKANTTKFEAVLRFLPLVSANNNQF